MQGYEPKVLDGAIATIQENRPIIFIEVELDQLSIYKFNEEDIFSRLICCMENHRRVRSA